MAESDDFVRAAALEAPRGIRVNVVSPPWVTDTLVKAVVAASIWTPEAPNVEKVASAIRPMMNRTNSISSSVKPADSWALAGLRVATPAQDAPVPPS